VCCVSNIHALIFKPLEMRLVLVWSGDVLEHWTSLHVHAHLWFVAIVVACFVRCTAGVLPFPCCSPPLPLFTSPHTPNTILLNAAASAVARDEIAMTSKYWKTSLFLFYVSVCALLHTDDKLASCNSGKLTTLMSFLEESLDSKSDMQQLWCCLLRAAHSCFPLVAVLLSAH